MQAGQWITTVQLENFEQTGSPFAAWVEWLSRISLTLFSSGYFYKAGTFMGFTCIRDGFTGKQVYACNVI